MRSSRFSLRSNRHSSSNYCCTFPPKSTRPHTSEGCQITAAVVKWKHAKLTRLFLTCQDSWYMSSTFYCITCFTLDTCRISKSLGTFWTQTEFYIFSFDIPLALKTKKKYIWLRSCKHNILVMHAFYLPTRPCITVDWTCVPKAIRIKKAFLRMSQGNEITINILSESFERRRKTSGTESLNSWRNTWLVVTFSVFPFEIQSIDVKVSTPWGKRKMEEWDTHLLPFIKLQDAQIFVRQFTPGTKVCATFFP